MSIDELTMTLCQKWSGIEALRCHEISNDANEVSKRM